MANSWYSYLGRQLDPLDSSSYRRVTIKPLCTTGTGVCAIYLLGETSTIPSNPLSSNLLRYITNSMVTLTPQPPIDAGVKGYVYLKPCCN